MTQFTKEETKAYVKKATEKEIQEYTSVANKDFVKFLSTIVPDKYDGTLTSYNLNIDVTIENIDVKTVAGIDTGNVDFSCRWHISGTVAGMSTTIGGSSEEDGAEISETHTPE